MGADVGGDQLAELPIILCQEGEEVGRIFRGQSANLPVGVPSGDHRGALTARESGETAEHRADRQDRRQVRARRGGRYSPGALYVGARASQGVESQACRAEAAEIGTSAFGGSATFFSIQRFLPGLL